MHSPSARKKGCARQHRAETMHLQLRIAQAFFFLSFFMALTGILRHYSGSQNTISRHYDKTKHLFERTALQIPWWFFSFCYLTNNTVEEFTTYLFTQDSKVGHKTRPERGRHFSANDKETNRAGSKKHPLLLLHTKYNPPKT